METQAVRARVHALRRNNMLSFHGLSRSLTEKVGNPVLLSLGCENMERPCERATPLEKGGSFSENDRSHLIANAKVGFYSKAVAMVTVGRKEVLTKVTESRSSVW